MLLTRHNVGCTAPKPTTPFTQGPLGPRASTCSWTRCHSGGKAVRRTCCKAGGASSKSPTSETIAAALASLCSKPIAISRKAEPSRRSVPLLGAQHGIPFTVGLEIVGHEEGDVPNLPSQPSQDADQEVLELVYVLSGSGVLSGWSTMNTSSSSSSSSSSGGGGGGGSATHATPTWALRPGVSALSWANSTHVSATHQLMQHPSKEQQQQQQQPQLALLKFLIPLALLDPASDDYGDTEAARSVLQGLGCTLQHGQERVQGVLDRAEAAQLLSHAHSRARGVFDMYPDKGQLPSSSHNGSNASTSTSSNSSSSSSWAFLAMLSPQVAMATRCCHPYHPRKACRSRLW